MAARLLLATTTWWPSIGLLASALEQAGFDVVVLCPLGHVATRAERFATRALDRRHPALSLADAIARVDPAIVVPGDERVVAHLGDLYRTTPHLRALIERSVGPEAVHRLLTARVALLEVAAEAGFTVPATRAIGSEADLARWLDEVPSPWVVKADGAWGGEGVRVAESRGEALRSFAALRDGMPAALALKKWLLNGDPMPWQERRAGHVREVSVQAHVAGRPATCALFALAGEVRGLTMVEAETTCGARGPATLMRAIERPDIAERAGQLVRRLGLSGFIGLDFLIDGDGIAHLLEMNPRITGPCRMRAPGRLDPVMAAAQAFACQPRGTPPPPRVLFASFPQAWLDDPGRPELLLCREDLPWREPGLLREALRPLWPERGPVAFLPARLRALRRRLISGRACPDLRQKPFSWWQTQASLQPPDSLRREDLRTSTASAARVLEHSARG